VILPILGGAYLGWSLGANDASNVFGTAVTSRMLRFSTAAVLCCVFLILGAALEGHRGIHTLDGLTTQTGLTAGLTALAAALTVTVMTLLKLPISTSQAVVGAIIGIGLLQGELDLGGLEKVVACWVGTPIGAMILAAVMYPLFGAILNALKLDMFRRDRLLRAGLVVVGSYGAYALGANNVANVSAMFVSGDLMSPLVASLVGGGCIALGVVTFSRRVMDTVGKGIIQLDAFSALVVVAAEAVTVHIYAMVGVPVSTSQAVIGAVLGVGLVRGARAVKLSSLRSIVLGWVLSPAVACAVAALLYILAHLRYTG
jgi:inorganic phosphate transporter, PiT family